jgi:hypothetical protein
VDLQRLTKDVRSIVGKNSGNDKMKVPVPATASSAVSLKAGAGGRQPSINIDSSSRRDDVACSMPKRDSKDNGNRDDISRPSRLSQSPLLSVLPSRAVDSSLTLGTHSLQQSVRPSLLFSRTLDSSPSYKQTDNDNDEAKDDDYSDFEEGEDEFGCGSERGSSRVR